MSTGTSPQRYPSVAALVEACRPNLPVLCIRPKLIEAAARRFTERFPGRVLYAVKCNPHPRVMAAVVAGGVDAFDVASPAEIEQVRGAYPEAEVAFMHPVKDRAAIREAYQRYAVRHFVVDHEDELAKVFEETGAPQDLFVFVRVRTPASGDVLYHLAAKFGADVGEAAALARDAASRGARVGLTFHVGSQCLDPKAYRTALLLLQHVVVSSGVVPSLVDVGGGFPYRYPGVAAPPLEAYFEEIHAGLREFDEAPPLWAEPGRALVAGGCSVLTQVRLRRGDQLYLNDGVYGCFSELIDSEYQLPARLHPASGAVPEAAREFVIHGPTCDSMDVLATPLLVPGNVAEGDWIEVGQIGAYSNALSTRFNGFSLETFAEVDDPPPCAEERSGDVADSS